MKKQTTFSGIVLVGLGVYFLANQLHLPLLRLFQDWPALLVIFGIAFIAQAYSAREYQYIFPGIVLFGFGLHFFLASWFQRWPNHVGMFFLIIAIAFFFSSRKTKTGLGQSIFFFAFAFILMFSERFSHLFHIVETGISSVWKFWPFGLIIVGVYILWRKRK
ncbi:LiaI-LiaF-like domain-containing protein [Parageobacillus thermoglucosidasius]|uniref:LiaI-LiaF-like transmembrane region domain-containing protein n=2 Tax=Anoxybacillaceae TaxID=3120669 RepID=A0AAN1D841_PARTM|nr:DUF5668 domain-containing protein [Parageobacillus thermoglucosidasius]KYD13948.1 hypothetical protein B4168_0769 [Anoxybacillus flavithermus]ALF11702.1 hypothetical protein AOT13_17670 [Parageobacillus thermoglucosidasius]ANZ31785.1 hypothetical protein BCV53_17730 [Parageobacillus thermoglucosidasius]APM82520.1 hypothetical protein BCV54_17745 [Parageobacillus thermoglucosidasius]EID45249.1 putative membrane protein [Parageobacillus thermoglucosidasius TNO-09.020]